MIGWYRYLESRQEGNSLKENMGYEDITQGITIRWEQPGSFRFGWFSNVNELYRFIQKTPGCFHEYTFANQPQKVRFDLDLKVSEIPSESPAEFAQAMLEELISAILEVALDLGETIDLCQDLAVCTAHAGRRILANNEVDLGKFSYHVITRKLAFATNEDVKEFARRVRDLMSEEFHPFLDLGVYKSIQSLRILGSGKLNDPNRVVIWDSLSYQGQTYTPQLNKSVRDETVKFRNQLQQSLITETSGVILLPSIAKTPTSRAAGQDISYKWAHVAMVALAKYAGTTLEDPHFPFSFEGVRGPMIILRRHKPSFCSLCNRVHESQSPYLVISGYEKKLTFVCRRAQDNNIRSSFVISKCLFSTQLEVHLTIKSTPSSRPTGRPTGRPTERPVGRPAGRSLERSKPEVETSPSKAEKKEDPLRIEKEPVQKMGLPGLPVNAETHSNRRQRSMNS